MGDNTPGGEFSAPTPRARTGQARSSLSPEKPDGYFLPKFFMHLFHQIFHFLHLIRDQAVEIVRPFLGQNPGRRLFFRRWFFRGRPGVPRSGFGLLGRQRRFFGDRRGRRRLGLFRPTGRGRRGGGRRGFRRRFVRNGDALGGQPSPGHARLDGKVDGGNRQPVRRLP